MTAIVLWFMTAAACVAYMHHRHGDYIYSHAPVLDLTHEQWIRRGVAIGLATYVLLKLLLVVLQGLYR